MVFSAAQVASFRLARHHLARPGRPTLTDVCGDVCGVQAQVMSAAELALWTRARHLTRDDIQRALWRSKSLVKTSCMRLTLHLVPADDFNLIITALKQSSISILTRVLARYHITSTDVTAMNELVMDALADGPLTQQDLRARARVKASRRLKVWLEHAWVAFRPAMVAGLICYGPPRGTEVTLVRVDRWLPNHAKLDGQRAAQMLLRRFLSAYGPADARDFAKWSGMPLRDVTPVWEALEPELAPVSVEGARGWMLPGDLRKLSSSKLDATSVRLLPAFDPLLLAHASKTHLVEMRHYKRVYRNQGWLSPVVLQGGRIIGVWSSKSTGKICTIDVQPFGRLDRAVQARIHDEAAALGRFLGARCEVKVGP